MKNLFIKYLIISISLSLISGCQLLQLFDLSDNTDNSINSISFNIDKDTVCINEDLLIRIDTDKDNSTNKVYNIHNQTGQKAILKFSTPGVKKVAITEKNLSTLKIKNKEIKITVNNCHLDENISIKISPDKSNLNVIYFSAEGISFPVQRYEWDFDDGNSSTTNKRFASHDYRMRKQNSLFSTFAITVTVFGTNGQKFSSRTSITLPNTDYISKMLGNPTVPAIYKRFMNKNNANYNLNVIFNNIYNSAFVAENVSIEFNNHSSVSPLQTINLNANEILSSINFPGQKASSSLLSFSQSIVPQYTTRITITIKGSLGNENNATTKLFIDLPPANIDVSNNQAFKKITDPAIINRLEEAEKMLGTGIPVTATDLAIMDGVYNNNTNIQDQWVFVPTKSHNLKKGDVILTKDPDGLLYPIFNNLGIVWDHTLMVVDNNGTMRHNTMKFNEELSETGVQMQDFTFRVYDPLDIVLLSKETFALPALLSQDILQGTPPGIINGNRSPEIFRVKLTTANGNNRQFHEGTADKIMQMEGNYILNSYINLESYEPTNNNSPANYNQGSQCSGTIWWANKRNGYPMNIPTISQPDVILFSSTNVYDIFVEYFSDMLTDKINEEFDSHDGFQLETNNNVLLIIINYGISYVEDYVKNEYKKQIMKHVFEKHKLPQKFANQIVNSFLFNRTGDSTDYWRNNYQDVDITSISPDDLLMLGIPELNSFGIRNSKYDLIENLTEGGGYYIKI